MRRTYHSVIKDPNIPPGTLCRNSVQKMLHVSLEMWNSDSPSHTNTNLQITWELLETHGHFLPDEILFNLKWPLSCRKSINAGISIWQAADLRPRALYVELLHTLVKLSRLGGFGVDDLAHKLIDVRMVLESWWAVSHNDEWFWRVGLWKRDFILNRGRGPCMQRRSRWHSKH